jgi:hypothetical protein
VNTSLPTVFFYWIRKQQRLNGDQTSDLYIWFAGFLKNFVVLVNSVLWLQAPSKKTTPPMLRTFDPRFQTTHDLPVCTVECISIP